MLSRPKSRQELNTSEKRRNRMLCTSYKRHPKSYVSRTLNHVKVQQEVNGPQKHLKPVGPTRYTHTQCIYIYIYVHIYIYIYMYYVDPIKQL